MEPKTAIAYCVYAPDRDAFLGRDSAWYSDIRMATIYHSPNPAKMASKRTETTFRKSVVEVRLTALPQSLEAARETKKPETENEPDKPPTAAQKAGTGANAKHEKK